jgi:hypothetical protein
MNKIKIILCLTLILIFSFSLSFAKGKKFLFNYKIGDETEYKFTISGEGKGGFGDNLIPFKGTVEYKIKTKVLDIYEDGTFELQVIPSDLKVGLKPIGIIELPTKAKELPLILRITKNGRIIEISGLERYPATTDAEVVIKLIGDGMKYFALIFPNKAIKKGDEWNEKIIKYPHFPVNVKYKFEGFKKIKGKKCAVIKANLVFPGTTLNLVPTGDYNPLRGKVKASPTYYFCEDFGTIIKYETPIEIEIYGLHTEQTKDDVNVRVLKIYFKGNASYEMQ